MSLVVLGLLVPAFPVPGGGCSVDGAWQFGLWGTTAFLATDGAQVCAPTISELNHGSNHGRD